MESSQEPSNASPPAGADGALPMQPVRRATVAFIFITVVLDVLALGVIIPVMPDLIKGFMGGDDARAAMIIGVFGTMWALMQFFCAPIMGALSDHFGRRPVILASNFALGLDYIIMALAPNLAWLFVGRIGSGITGASYTAAAAYIADVTPPEKRAAGYGIIGAAWGLGFVLGPAMGGVLSQTDLRLPFWISAALTLLNSCYGLFVLPESLPRERRSPFTLRRANPIGSLALLRSHRGLLGMASIWALYWLAHFVFQTVFVLSAERRFEWTPLEVGLALAAAGICGIIVQAVVVKRFVARFGERIALTTGLVAAIIGYAMYGWAPNSALFLTAIPLFALAGLIMPSVQSLMTRRVPPTEQGRLQGANSCITGIMGMIGPGLHTQVYAWFVTREGFWHIPGAPFVFSAALMVVALVVARSRATEQAAPPATQHDRSRA